ncbi:stalk domain-containing protein [Clostridium sp. MCC345]|uniref:stalk domain-containing protein n=1 Tax=Clostridium sp. MCC345 TaxID=2592645 RepID=UPI001C009DD8
MKKNYYAKALALTVAASMVSVPAFAAEENDAATLQADAEKGIATLPLLDEEKPVVVAEPEEEEPTETPKTHGTTGDEAAAVALQSEDSVISEDTEWTDATTLSEDLTIAEGKTLTLKGQVTISGDVTISGGTIKRGEAFKDYMIVVPEGSSLTLKDVKIDGGAVWEGSEDTTLGRGTENGGVEATSAMIYNFGTLTVKSGTILENNDNTTTSGAIAMKDEETGEYTFPSVTDKVRFGGAVLNGGLMKISGGTIRNNNVGWRGAGIASYGKIEMTGGTISGNYARNGWGDGGAIYLSGVKNDTGEDYTASDASYCTISDGNFTNNKSDGAGGAVCADGYSILYVKGGTFENNAAATTGGGINVYSSCLRMSGGTISENTAVSTNDSTGNGGGLNLTVGSVADITGGTIENNQSNSGGGIYANGKSSFTASNLKITGNTAATNGGGICIPGTKDYEYNVSLENVLIQGNKSESGSGAGICAARAWKEETSTGVLTLKNCQIKENYGTVAGGGIYLDKGVTATMDGGEISGNHVINPTSQTNGGGIAVGGTFTLNSGKISDNIKDGSWNGGAAASVSGTFTMNGGEVSGNIDTCTAENAENRTIGGGAFYVLGGTLNINGGTITNNTSHRGGAIAFHYGPYNRGTVHITGGKIVGNYVTGGEGGAINMTSARKKGDSVYDQTVTISGSPVIANNKKGAKVNVAGDVYTVDTSAATAENNIYLSLNNRNELGDAYAERQTIHLGQLKDGASIGVTTETQLQKGRTVQITTAETDTKYYKDSAKYFVPDTENTIVAADETGNYLKLAYSDENYYKVTLNLSHAKVEGATVTQIKQGEDYTATIIADTGYTLPETAPDRTTYSSFSEDKKSASIEIKNVDENKTVSLAAIPNKYTVTFDGNGSTDGAMKVQTMTYDTSDALSENKYTRTGYNFAGWSTTKGETSEYPDKVSVKNLTAENNGNVTLYAVWTKKETIPAFDSGENAVQSSKYDGTGKAYTLTSELEGFTISYKKGEETVAAPTAVGTYDVIITRAEDDTYEAFSQTITGGLVITAADYPVSVVADKETMRGAGTVKLTADSTVDEIKVTGIVCSDDSIKPTKNEDGTYSVSLPNATKTYIFTAQIDGDLSNYGEGTASCTVSVSRKKSSSSSSDTSAPTYGVNTGKTENGKISVTPAKAEAGEKVTIKATPDSGYQLDKVTVKDKDNSNVKLTKVNDNEYTFTMPKGKVSVDATFVQKDAADANQNSAAEKSKVIKLQIGSRIVNVDNEAVIYDAAPVIRNDRTLVPIRIVTETLGGKVDWNGATKEVTLHIDGKEIKMTVGKTLEKYGVAPVIIDGRTFVPVRFVADELGATVAWDDATKTVTITKIEK